MKILFFVNSVDNILNYRLNLINYLIKKDFKIEILLPKSEDIKKLSFLKLKIYSIDFEPRSLNFFLDIILLFKIYKVFNRSKPDLILQFTVKPVIYGSIISRLLKLNVDTISTNAASIQNYNNTGPQLVTANELYTGNANNIINLQKNKAPTCNTPWPLNFSQSGKFQNKKFCKYKIF